VLTFEAADDVEVDPFELEEVVELADEWLSELLILLRNLSNSEIFLSKLMAADAADSLSASKVLKEAANWLKAASKGNEDEEDGVEGLEEKSLREDMGDDEFEVPFPAICL
jgi:hypothetical protein